MIKRQKASPKVIVIKYVQIYKDLTLWRNNSNENGNDRRTVNITDTNIDSIIPISSIILMNWLNTFLFYQKPNWNEIRQVISAQLGEPKLRRPALYMLFELKLIKALPLTPQDRCHGRAQMTFGLNQLHLHDCDI